LLFKCNNHTKENNTFSNHCHAFLLTKRNGLSKRHGTLKSAAVT
jgi:hypothetical protein